MKIVIFGLGSIGSRHAKILRSGFGCTLYAYRSAGNAVNKFGIPELRNWQEVEALKPRVAFITNPTFLHMDTAIECAKRGMHLFIEKPLSHTLRRIDELEGLCNKRRLTTYVAYCMRFHPCILKMKEALRGKSVTHIQALCSSYLPEWRPGTDHRRSYSASQELGGGVLLDLSHEFDYIGYLFGPIKTISGRYGRASDVSIDAEDNADLVMKTDGGVRADLHLDYMTPGAQRRAVVKYKGGYMEADFIKGEFYDFNKGRKAVSRFKVDYDSLLKDQARYFFSRIGKRNIMNSVPEARSLLEKILEFEK